MKTYKTNITKVRLVKEKTDFPKAKISNSKDSADFARQFYHEDLEIYESVFLLLLNRANNTIGYAKISQGGTVGTVIDVKLIVKYAIDSLAQSVILFHNHPSGQLYPSKEDTNITIKTQRALEFMDVRLLDHVILTADSYYSFADNGQI